VQALHVAAHPAQVFLADPFPVLRTNGRHGCTQIAIFLSRPTPGSTVHVFHVVAVADSAHGHGQRHQQRGLALAPLRRRRSAAGLGGTTRERLFAGEGGPSSSSNTTSNTTSTTAAAAQYANGAYRLGQGVAGDVAQQPVRHDQHVARLRGAHLPVLGQVPLQLGHHAALRAGRRRQQPSSGVAALLLEAQEMLGRHRAYKPRSAREPPGVLGVQAVLLGTLLESHCEACRWHRHRHRQHRGAPSGVRALLALWPWCVASEQPSRFQLGV
jgi:hypothetical protein